MATVKVEGDDNLQQIHESLLLHLYENGLAHLSHGDIESVLQDRALSVHAVSEILNKLAQQVSKVSANNQHLVEILRLDGQKLAYRPLDTKEAIK